MRRDQFITNLRKAPDAGYFRGGIERSFRSSAEKQFLRFQIFIFRQKFVPIAWLSCP